MAKKRKADASTEQGAGQVRVPAKKVSGSVKKAQANIPKKVLNTSGKVKGAAKKAPAKKAPQNSETPTTTTPPAGGDAPVNPPTPAGETEAHRTLRRYLSQAGFPLDMTDYMMEKMNSGELPEDAQLEDYIAVSVDHPSFKARFPVIVEQWKKREAGDMNVQIMTPGEVIDYEKQIRATADDYGLSGWVSSPDQVSTLIMNDVDVEEAKERINLAGYAAMTAPKTFREAFMGRFGLTEGNLVGFFLDPNREEGEIRKQVTLGNVMGAALAHGFGNDWRTAEGLYNRGFIPSGASVDSVMSEFARAALSSGLSSGLGDTVSESDRIGSAFGDAEATRRLTNVAAQRAGRFNTSGGAVEGQKGVSGLGTASST